MRLAPWLLAGILAAPCRAAARTIYYGSYASTPRRPDGHVDAQAIADGAARGRMNFYNYLIYGGDSDWSDLTDLLRTTKDRDLSVIVDLIPPSEKPCSKPYCYDFAEWGRNIAALSLSFPHLVGFSIDDFTLNFPGEGGRLDPAIAKMLREAKAVNPRILFLPTVYGPHRARFDPNYKGTADGLLLYTEFYDRAGAMPDTAYWAKNIAEAKRSFPIVIEGVYAIGRGPAPPSEFPVAKARLAHDLGATGVMMYLLGWSGPTWDAITGLYAQWNPAKRGVAAATLRRDLERLEDRAQRLARKVASELYSAEPEPAVPKAEAGQSRTGGGSCVGSP